MEQPTTIEQARSEIFELATKLLDSCDFQNAVGVLAALAAATYHVAHAMQHATFPGVEENDDENFAVIDSCMRMGVGVAMMLDDARHTQVSEVVKA